MLEQRPGFGTVVRGRLPDNFSEFLNLPLISDAKETIELVKARRYIEVGNVELAVEHATDEEVSELGRILSAMADAARTNDQDAYVLQGTRSSTNSGEGNGQPFHGALVSHDPAYHGAVHHGVIQCPAQHAGPVARRSQVNLAASSDAIGASRLRK